MARRGQPLRELDGQHRLAAPGRPRDRGPLSVRDEPQDPRLVARELDDLLVLLVEPKLQRHPDLDPEPEGHGQRVHPLPAEPAALPPPVPHDLPDPLLEASHVVPVDDNLGWGPGVRLPLVQPVGERHAVAVGRLPPFPAGLGRQDLDQGAHLVVGLAERVLVQDVRAGASRLAPPPGLRVVGEAAALRLDDQDAVLRVRDHEVGLALDRPPWPGKEPVHAVVDDVGVVELLEKALVQAPFGRALRREHWERHHPSHAGMLAGAGRRTRAGRWTSDGGSRPVPGLRMGSAGESRDSRTRNGS